MSEILKCYGRGEGFCEAVTTAEEEEEDKEERNKNELALCRKQLSHEGPGRRDFEEEDKGRAQGATRWNSNPCLPFQDQTGSILVPNELDRGAIKGRLHLGAAVSTSVFVSAIMSSRDCYIPSSARQSHGT
jgi:hypothetical protein